MEFYFGLIIFILLLPALLRPFFKANDARQKAIAFCGMFAIFLVLALKGDVGNDIPGYREQYYLSAEKAWDDFDYVYFENGYILLMKVFSKFGLDFQVFMAFIYAIACTAIYMLIRKFSKDAMFSLIIFVCYMFFVFYISGVRQCLAMSICIFSFLLFRKEKPFFRTASFIVLLVATYIHQSALVFLAVLPVLLIKSMKINLLVYCGGIIASVIARPWVWTFVDKYIRHITNEAAIELAGNFIFLCGISLLMYFLNSKVNFLQIKFSERAFSEDENKDNVFFTRAILLSLLANILFSGHTMLRAAAYLTVFIIPALPNAIWKLDLKTRLLLKSALIVFFIILFYTETLMVNQLGLLPYVFFWE